MIPISKFSIEPFKEAARDAIDSGYISSFNGKYIKLAGEILCDKLQTKHCLLTANGTCAVHLMYLSIKYKYPTINTIYVPNYVFATVYNMALVEFLGSNIHVLEFNEDTWNMREDEEYIMSLEPNSAVVIAHNLGNIVNVPRLIRLRPDLVFVEDNCEGLFGTYEGKPSGSASLCSTLSFYGNKSITTGEGGAWLTNDTDLYNFIVNTHSHGMSKTRYIHDKMGYNYRITNVQAGFLYDQMLVYDELKTKRREVFDEYKSIFEKSSELFKTQKIQKDTEHSCWMFAVKLNKCRVDFQSIDSFMFSRGVETRPFFYPVSAHAYIQSKIQDKVCENKNIIVLPTFYDLKKEQMQKIKIELENGIKGQLKLIDQTNDERERRDGGDDNKKLKEFYEKARHGIGGFRYFMKRDLESAMKTHVFTVVYQVFDTIVGYAHIDFDKDQNRYWFGICVLPDFQNKGIGSLLEKYCMDNFSSSDKLYLTVDKTNDIAIQMYVNRGWILTTAENKRTSFVFTKTKNLMLPVSLGEAVDKLTILDIKRSKIQNPVFVEKEFQLLEKELGNHLKSPIVSFWYDTLKAINLSIWEIQDEYRDTRKEELCMKIITENDRRFRVKNKINTNSLLKEQKGYALLKTRIEFKELSDSDTETTREWIASVNYLTTTRDIVEIVCKDKEQELICKNMFPMNNSIIFSISKNNNKE